VSYFKVLSVYLRESLGKNTITLVKFLGRNMKTDPPEEEQEIVGSEHPAMVIMKCSVFWDISPCNPLKVNRRFGGTYRLHLESRRIDHARKQRGSRR
jgi:hypothetical protein